MQDTENKGFTLVKYSIDLTYGLWLSGAKHNPETRGFCSALILFYRVCQAFGRQIEGILRLSVRGGAVDA